MSDDTPQLFVDVDADDSKALRSWMIQVNNHLHRNGLINSEQRQQLHDRAMEATGWDDA